MDECEQHQEACWTQNVTAVEHVAAACAQPRHSPHATSVPTSSSTAKRPC
ncbi:MAG: hypothetical protein WKG07_24725 [Hymenobacter sp.]